jgi:[ribosomal protein S5]-alanine N-acetyltransferase
MAKSDVIRTETLLLVPFSEEYLTQKYVGWLNDPEVVRFSEQRFVQHTIESCRTYMDSYDTGPNYFWAIISCDPAEGHIGNINAIVDVNNGVADIGIILGEKSVWGKGYGREAFTAIVNFLFQEVGVRKVTAGTVAINTSMVRIMERAGMKSDGSRARHCMFADREVDLIHAALFREEWLAHNQ